MDQLNNQNITNNKFIKKQENSNDVMKYIQVYTKHVMHA